MCELTRQAIRTTESHSRPREAGLSRLSRLVLRPAQGLRMNNFVGYDSDHRPPDQYGSWR